MIEYFNITSGNWYFHLLIGIILFLLFKWLFGKFLIKRNLKLFLNIITTIILTPIVYYFAVTTLFSILFFEYHPENKFESKKWIENEQTRHEMRNDLINSKILLGKTKSELFEILGEPQSTFIINNDTINNFNYYMGSVGHGMGIKMYQLNIEFKNEKVEKVENIESID